MIELISSLSSLRLAPNSKGLDECVKILRQVLPFNIIEVPGGSEENGWVCPLKWEVNEAKIINSKGKVVYDGLSHPLAVIGYSQPFKGRVTVEELKKHLYYSNVFDDAIVYHCDLFYKTDRKDWGFCIPKNIYDQLNDTHYEVILDTSFEKGTMKIAEYVLKGESEESIILNAHNCHPCCCNDDLAGVAVGVEVLKELSKIKKRRFTYRLIIAPEHFGSIFYLAQLTDQQISNLKYGIFIEMVGTEGPFALQRSFKGNTLMDTAFLSVLKNSAFEWRTDLFRKVVGNDETCWEAPGYEIPFPSISRSLGPTHFPEYHTDKDNVELMNPQKLNDSVKLIMDVLFIMENDSVIKRRFKGLVALSNPKYNLYKRTWDPSEHDRHKVDDKQKKWNYLMDCLPRYFNATTTILEISEKHNLSFKEVHAYVKEFEDKGLVSIKAAPIDYIPKNIEPY